VSKLETLRARLSKEGPKSVLAWLGEEAGARLIDAHRELIVLEVDLTDPRNHSRARDARDATRIVPFDRESLPRLLEALERHAPQLVERVRARFLEGMLGFVAEDAQRGEVLGYTFYTPGGDAGARLAHRDLGWLGLTVGPGEVYAFDYFVVEHARGRGAAFVRAVQEEQARLGYAKAYGYVYAANRAALWLYRTTGWREVSRIEEHRLLTRLALVDGTLYWMYARGRTPVGRLPAPLAGLAERALAKAAPKGAGAV
jgi:GNAT superfamily N-acetyltransferase